VTTQQISLLLNLVKQQPLTLGCIDFARLFDFNLAIAYDLIAQGISLLFGKQINGILVDTQLERVATKMFDEVGFFIGNFELERNMRFKNKRKYVNFEEF
jgi:hypothetical protein